MTALPTRPINSAIMGPYIIPFGGLLVLRGGAAKVILPSSAALGIRLTIFS